MISHVRVARSAPMRSPPYQFPACKMGPGWVAMLVTKPRFTFLLSCTSGHPTACGCVLLFIVNRPTAYSASRRSSVLPSTVQCQPGSQVHTLKPSFVILPSLSGLSSSTQTMIETNRRRLLGALNSRYIYGKVVSIYNRKCLACTRRGPLIHFSQPLLHTLVFLLQIAIVSILVRRFNSYYAKRPGMYSK
jgi:hypothetical protein